MKLDPGVWKCPHGHTGLFFFVCFFSLSSESLSVVCLLSLRLNQRTWQRSADAPGSQDRCSEVLRLSIIKNSVRRSGAVIPREGQGHRRAKVREIVGISGGGEYQIIGRWLGEMRNKVALILDFWPGGPEVERSSHESSRCGPRSLFLVQATMAVVQVFPVRGSNRGPRASPGLLFIPSA